MNLGPSLRRRYASNSTDRCTTGSTLNGPGTTPWGVKNSCQVRNSSSSRATCCEMRRNSSDWRTPVLRASSSRPALMPINGCRISWTSPGPRMSTCGGSSLVAIALHQVGCGSGGGKQDGEGRAAPGRAVDEQLAVVRLDDAVRDGETQPDARRPVLGAEERIEDPFPHFRRNALSRVAHGELERVSRDVGQADAQLAALGHRRDRVLQQVRHHLLDLHGVPLRLAQARLHLPPQVDALLAHLLGVQLESALHRLLEGKPPSPFAAFLLGELPQVADDLAHPARLLQRLLERVRLRRA